MTSGISHLIGNLEIVPVENGEVPVKTAFLVYRAHLEAGSSTPLRLSRGRTAYSERRVEGEKAHDRRDANVLLDSPIFPRHSNSGCGVQHVAGLSVTQHEREDVCRPFYRLLEGRPMPPVIEQYQARVGNVIEDRMLTSKGTMRS
jgi:hypothetical protein